MGARTVYCSQKRRLSPRSWPGRVKSARGGADRAVLLRGRAWGRLNDPRQWRPPWTTREPSSGECSPRPPGPGVLRLSISSAPRVLLGPESLHPRAFSWTPSSSSLPHPIRPLPSLRWLWSPCKSEPPGLFPPSPASAHRLSSPEVSPTEGRRCPVGHSRSAWESAKSDSGEGTRWGRLCISCNS